MQSQLEQSLLEIIIHKFYLSIHEIWYHIKSHTNIQLKCKNNNVIIFEINRNLPYSKDNSYFNNDYICVKQHENNPDIFNVYLGYSENGIIKCDKTNGIKQCTNLGEIHNAVIEIYNNFKITDTV